MPRQPITSNTLFYGDNLDMLRGYIADQRVDLCYLDPPFNSSRNYNVLFKRGGTDSHETGHSERYRWSVPPTGGSGSPKCLLIN